MNEIKSVIKDLEKFGVGKLKKLGISLSDPTFKSFKLLDKYTIGIEGNKIHINDILEQPLSISEEEMEELLEELEQRFNQAIRL